MKPFPMLALLCASVLWVSPLYAHGGEEHGQASSAAVSSDVQASGTGAAVTTSDAPAGDGHAAGSHEEAAGESTAETGGGVVDALKKLHPATIHFPIALFLMAALTELFMIGRKNTGLEPAVRVLVYGGAGGAVIAVLFGWIHTGLWFGGDAAMQVHRWNGMLIAFLGVALAFLASTPRNSRALLRFGLLSMAALVLVQGFLGGELAHGPDHLGISGL